MCTASMPHGKSSNTRVRDDEMGTFSFDTCIKENVRYLSHSEYTRRKVEKTSGRYSFSIGEDRYIMLGSVITIQHCTLIFSKMVLIPYTDR